MSCPGEAQGEGCEATAPTGPSNLSTSFRTLCTISGLSGKRGEKVEGRQGRKGKTHAAVAPLCGAVATVPLMEGGALAFSASLFYPNREHSLLRKGVV